MVRKLMDYNAKLKALGSRTRTNLVLRIFGSFSPKMLGLQQNSTTYLHVSTEALNLKDVVKGCWALMLTCKDIVSML